MVLDLKLAVVASVLVFGDVTSVLAASQTTTATPSGLAKRFESNISRISFKVPSLAPMAFIRFCNKYPQDCEIRFAPSPPVALTSTRMGELVAVNRAVNRAIEPRADNRRVTQEEWLLSPRAGDCNDYAVSKRHRLIARGWPSRSLLLTEVVLSSGKHHLVLVVRTREDDFILDNLADDIRPVSQGRYKWFRGQQEKNPKLWSIVSVNHL
jgi:predicted transglutaminase-like cysteine proteinase